MKGGFWNEFAIEFFEQIILSPLSQLLPGGKRWLRLYEEEKLTDIPSEEILLLIEERKISVVYIKDHEIFDYMEICEMLESCKCFNAAPELREKLG
jgi:hypothetical protein